MYFRTNRPMTSALYTPAMHEKPHSILGKFGEKHWLNPGRYRQNSFFYKNNGKIVGKFLNVSEVLIFAYDSPDTQLSQTAQNV